MDNTQIRPTIAHLIGPRALDAGSVTCSGKYVVIEEPDTATLVHLSNLPQKVTPQVPSKGLSFLGVN